MTTVSDLVWRCKPSNVLLIIGNIQSCTSVPSNAFLVSLVLAIPSVCPCCSTSSGNSVLHPYSGSTSQCCFMLMLDPEAKERRSGRFRHLAWSPMVPVVICSKLSGSNDAILWVHSYLYYWLVGWNLFYFSICIGKNIPNWLIMTSIFQSGWNHQPDIILYLKLSIFWSSQSTMTQYWNILFNPWWRWEIPHFEKAQEAICSMVLVYLPTWLGMTGPFGP